MAALTRVGMLVERGAVELREPVRIVGEVPRHPVEQHADSGLVEGVDQQDELFRRAEAAGGREQAGGLVTPGAVEGMLHHREQFDMGEAHVGAIGRKLLGQFAIAQPEFPVLAFAPP